MMNIGSTTIDETNRERIMESDDLRKLLRVLVQEDIKTRDGSGDPLKKLSDLLSKAKSGQNFDVELTKQFSGKVIPINDLHGEYGCHYSDEEKVIRCQLASLYRLMALHGWTLIIYNHITYRNKGDSEEFFINPLGLLYREITASSLVKINLEGQTLDPGSTVFGINKAGWNLHAAVHEIRKDVRCIIHTHVPDVIAVSCLKYGLLPISEEAVDLLDESLESLSGGVRYHDYWGVAVVKEEWPSLTQDIGLHSKVLFLRNHGVLVCGNDCVEAWILMKRVIRACENQVRILQTKGEKGLLAMDHLFYPKATDNGTCDEDNLLKIERITSIELEFEAEMQMLDNAGYRTGYHYRHSSLPKKGGCGINGDTGNVTDHFAHLRLDA